MAAAPLELDEHVALSPGVPGNDRRRARLRSQDECERGVADIAVPG